MHHHRYLRAIVLIVPFVLLPAGSGCARTKAESPVLIVTPWEGRLQSLFDDSIDPASIGLAPTTTDPADANVARGQAAHFVVRTRVTTITVDGAGPSRRYLLTLDVVGAPIVGPTPENDVLNLVVGIDSPSFGLVQSKDIGLAGTRFVAFVRNFEERDGSSFHWHLARDTDDVVSAARKGAALEPIAD